MVLTFEDYTALLGIAKEFECFNNPEGEAIRARLPFGLNITIIEYVIDSGPVGGKYIDNYCLEIEKDNVRLDQQFTHRDAQDTRQVTHIWDNVYADARKRAMQSEERRNEQQEETMLMGKLSLEILLKKTV